MPSHQWTTGNSRPNTQTSRYGSVCCIMEPSESNDPNGLPSVTSDGDSFISISTQTFELSPSMLMDVSKREVARKGNGKCGVDFVLDGGWKWGCFLERVCFGVLMHGLCGGIEGLLMKGCLSWCVGDDRGRWLWGMGSVCMWLWWCCCDIWLIWTWLWNWWWDVCERNNELEILLESGSDV